MLFTSYQNIKIISTCLWGGKTTTDRPSFVFCRHSCPQKINRLFLYVINRLGYVSYDENALFLAAFFIFLDPQRCLSTSISLVYDTSTYILIIKACLV